jgi:hypothetical protein
MGGKIGRWVANWGDGWLSRDWVAKEGVEWLRRKIVG